MKIDRNIYEVIYYNNKGDKMNGHPMYFYNWNELIEHNKTLGINMSDTALTTHVVDKVPCKGGQTVNIRIYRTTIKELIKKINQQAFNFEEEFNGVHKFPLNTIRESLSHHPNLCLHYLKGNPLPQFRKVKPPADTDLSENL